MAPLRTVTLRVAGTAAAALVLGLLAGVPPGTIGLPLGAAGLAPGPAYAEPSASDLAEQLAQASSELDVVVEAYDAATGQLAGLQQRASALAARLAPLSATADLTRAQLGAAVSGLYEQGAPAGLNALLGAGTPEATLDALSSLRYLADQRDLLLAGYQAASAALNAQQDEVDLATARVRNQQASLAAQRQAIQGRIDALEQLRRKLYGSTRPAPPRVDSYVPSYQAGPAGVAVRYAFAQIGKAYQYGAAGPDAYDCSGLTMASWRQAGVSLPHSAAQQWRVVSHLAASQLQPGDLVFYYSDIHHVAIYIGGGRVVHAPTWGQSVTTAPVDLAPIYGYGRVKI